jgi:hypothetical protein
MNVRLNLMIARRHRVITKDHVNFHRGVAPRSIATERGVCGPPGGCVSC